EHLPELGEHRSELGGVESAGATRAAPAEGAAGAERSAGSPRAGARVVAGRVVVVAPVVVGGGESEGLVHATTVQARPGWGHGREADETTVTLKMTTVAVRDKLTLVDAMRFWLDRRQVVVPRDQVFPPDRSEDEVRESNTAAMVGSENSAEAAAYRHLGIPMHPRVEDVDPEGAAAGALEAGDILTSVGGVAVADSTEVVEQVSSHGPGDEVELGFTRDGRDETTTTSLQPAGPDGDPEEGRLGILVGDTPADGTDVDINVGPEVGGPSAGLVMALAIVDKLSPGEVTGGERVAGSGTIQVDGTVGPIGGISHKIYAAHEDGVTEFLVPSANCAEAVQGAPDGIRLLEVSTLDGALDALDEATSGGQPPTCG